MVSAGPGQGSEPRWPWPLVGMVCRSAPTGAGGDHVCSVLSVKSARAPREVRRRWPRAAALGAGAALAALLLWGGLAGEDGVTEVLAHRGEVLPGRFIEVPCSEDYNSHRRFEGRWRRGDPGKSGAARSREMQRV